MTGFHNPLWRRHTEIDKWLALLAVIAVLTPASVSVPLLDSLNEVLTRHLAVIADGKPPLSRCIENHDVDLTHLRLLECVTIACKRICQRLCPALQRGGSCHTCSAASARQPRRIIKYGRRCLSASPPCEKDAPVMCIALIARQPRESIHRLLRTLVADGDTFISIDKASAKGESAHIIR